MREYSIFQPDVPMGEVPFLKEFPEDPDCGLRDDSDYSEFELQAGLVRHDWDGDPAISKASDKEPSSKDKKDKLPDKADSENFESILESLGYYISEETLSDTITLFRSRWKERKPRGKGFRNMLRTEGGMDAKAMKLLTSMVRQWDRL